MKKVLLVSHVSGFIPQFEMENVQTLQEMGCEVHYASNYNTPQYGNDNSRLEGTGIIRHQVDFVRSPYQLIKNWIAFTQMVKLLYKENFDMIHCHTPMGGVIARLSARCYIKKKIKVIYTVHGFHFFKGAPIRNWICYYPMEKMLARLTDVLITINEEDYQRALRFKLRKGGEIERINGVGVDLDKIKILLNDNEKEAKKTNSKFVLLSIGEINKNKNQRLVIEALHKMSQKEIQYWVCGKGKYQTRLEALVEKYHLTSQVHFLGYQSDVMPILRKADVFILPSFREGLSAALQESMASGLPAIVTDIRGNNELIDDQQGGWLIPSNSVEAMIQSIQMAMKTDLHAMGIYNQKKIEKYDKKIVKKKMERIYRSIL